MRRISKGLKVDFPNIIFSSNSCFNESYKAITALRLRPMQVGVSSTQ